MAKVLIVLSLFVISVAAKANASLAVTPASKTASADEHPTVVNPSVAKAQDDVGDDNDVDAPDAATSETVAPKATSESVAPNPHAFLSSKSVPAAVATKSVPAAVGTDSLEMTSASMEKAMTELMLGNNAFGATPMGGSVKKISDVIRKTMMPKVKAAHTTDQKELHRLIEEIKKCGSTKNGALGAAAPQTKKYKSESKSHKKCRSDEAVKFTTKKNCLTEQKSAFQLKTAECNKFSELSKKYGTTKDNRAIVTKAGSETTESYLTRISATICGNHNHGKKGTKKVTGGWGGGLSGGFLDKYWKAREKCEKAEKKWKDKVKECKKKVSIYNTRIAQCDQFQSLMDSASCKSAIITNDACQTYSECYKNTVELFKEYEGVASNNELDRKAEWRGLKRIDCLIEAFADGKVTDKEVTACKKRSVDTALMNLKFPKVPALQKCAVPQMYPSTGMYKRTEFNPLPMLAKGKESVPCVGMREVSTKPGPNSPGSCKCSRVTLNGAYSARAMVMCKNCIDVRRSTDKNSCPKGTKIFSPATRDDWKTFLASAKPLNAPHFIVDVTNPTNGCGGCTNHAMNSRVTEQKAWRTSDGSKWWLRSTKYGEPNGNYEANCYLNVRANNGENSITFDDNRCHFHAKSYYCQLERINLKPGGKSPKTCKCTLVDLTGSYSPGRLIKCEQCIDVRKATQSNSCPAGTKIFSPRTRGDWKTFLSSAVPLQAPHFIIDVTRPQNSCGGCTRAAMKSTTPAQATWRTQDRSPWWLRSTTYSEPNGDYHANCFMHLKSPFNGENNIQFNDGSCHYHSRSYYCQPKLVKKPPAPAPAPAPPPPKPKSGRFGSKHKGLKYNMYTTCASMSANGLTCYKPTIQYGNTKGGVPAQHSNNNYGEWCSQLGFSSSGASVTYGSRTCTAPGGKGKLFWCGKRWGGGYDEHARKWCDWQDGKWHNQRLDYPCNGQMITSVTCRRR